MAVAWRRTQGPASGLASGKKDQAAVHRYSMTWMKSQMMVRVMSRAAASARNRASWWTLPSASAIQVRRRTGSRRSPSAKTAATTVAASAVTLAVTHLWLALGAAGGGAGAGRGQDIGGGAGDGGDVVDGADLGDPLAVADLAAGQPPVLLGSGFLAGFAGGLRAHLAGQDHDALAVAGQDQHVTGPGVRRRPVPGVEVLEVRRGLPGQLLGLPLAQPGSGDTGDLRADLAERAARGQRRGLAAQPVRMLAPGQVQLPVRPVHIRRARRPVRDPGHRDRPEHRRQRPRVPRLGPGPGGPVRARHARLPLLPGSPQIQVIL